MLRRVLQRRAEEAPPSPCWQSLVAALGSGQGSAPQAELIQQAVDSFSMFAAGGQEQGVVQHCPIAHSILHCISSAADGLTSPHITHEDLVTAVKRGLHWEQQQQAHEGGAAGEGRGCAWMQCNG